MFDKRSGGPFDCGVRTYYYGRNENPHCYRGGCNMKGQYTEELTQQEIKEFPCWIVTGKHILSLLCY